MLGVTPCNYWFLLIILIILAEVDEIKYGVVNLEAINKLIWYVGQENLIYHVVLISIKLKTYKLLDWILWLN